MMMIRGAIILGLLGLCSLGQAQDTINQDCDPRVTHRFDACPDGYCCVRDEFLPTWVYCKKLGMVHESCTTRDTETNCPCMDGMQCHPNIVSSTGMASLYGKCALVTTTAPPTTTTPLPTTTHDPDAATTLHPHCPHGHSCEHEHHHTHETHPDHGHHHTVDPITVIGK